MSKKQKAAPAKVLTINWSGNATHALLQESKGTVMTGEHAGARCNPGDIFDAYEGARIALARVFDKDPFEGKQEKTAKPENDTAPKKKFGPVFKVGDIVRRTWSGFKPEYRGGYGKIVHSNSVQGHWIHEVLLPDGGIQAFPEFVGEDDRHHYAELVYREEEKTK